MRVNAGQFLHRHSTEPERVVNIDRMLSREQVDLVFVLLDAADLTPAEVTTVEMYAEGPARITYLPYGTIEFQVKEVTPDDPVRS